MTPARLEVCVDAFARGAFDRPAALLRRMCDAATPLDACERVLTPVVRSLGERWEADTCDFATLTMAMSRMHALLHRVGRAWTPEAATRPLRRVLVSSAPGEQHIFGPAMLAEAFRGAGWEVTTPQGATARDLVTRVRAGGFDVVGLSLACEAGLEGLGRLVAELRSAARSAAPAILVGGRPFVERPELARMIGADGTAADCAATLVLADTLTQRLKVAA